MCGREVSTSGPAGGCSTLRIPSTESPRAFPARVIPPRRCYRPVRAAADPASLEPAPVWTPIACAQAEVADSCRVSNLGVPLRQFLPYRDVARAAAREGLALPVAPALAQGHSGKPGHEV